MQFHEALSNLPKPSAHRIALRVSAEAEKIIRQGHPWVFDQSIIEQSHRDVPGELAVIFDSKRKFFAIGLYYPTSLIQIGFKKK